MNVRQFALAIAIASLPSAQVFGAVTALNVELTDPSPLSGYTSNDLHIDFDGSLRGQQLVVQLTAGSIFHDAANPGAGPPPESIISAIPTAAYDTFVTLGGLTQETSYPVVTGPGTIVSTCDPLSGCAFNIAWAPGTGVDIPTATDFVVARITLSHDAAGVAHYLGTTATGTGDPYFATGSIQNGVISFVPEPTSLILFGFGVLITLLGRRSAAYA